MAEARTEGGVNQHMVCDGSMVYFEGDAPEGEDEWPGEGVMDGEDLPWGDEYEEGDDGNE